MGGPRVSGRRSGLRGRPATYPGEVAVDRLIRPGPLRWLWYALTAKVTVDALGAFKYTLIEMPKVGVACAYCIVAAGVPCRLRYGITSRRYVMSCENGPPK